MLGGQCQSTSKDTWFHFTTRRNNSKVSNKTSMLTSPLANYSLGRGTVNRISSHFTKHVENTSSDMYTSASLAIIKELNRVDKALLHEPSRAVHNILEKIVTDLRNLINRTGMHDGTGKTNILKLDLRRHVLREIDDLETRWGQTINSNQESQLNAKNTLDLLKIPVIDLDEEYVDFDDEEDEDFGGGEHRKSVDGPFHL